MAKGRKNPAVWQGFLAGSLLSLGVYLLGLLFLTLLLVKGTLSENGSFPMVAALCVLATLSGGLLTVRLTLQRAGGVLTAVVFLSVLLLAGLGIWEEIAWLGRGGILLLCGLAGGLLAGVAGPKGRRRRK
ncbi:hypothetical protein [uncultured Oscillibacter sp.]|uniref:hypothetical protein n=1 Tax=uncultured Oscillibacter sp. TaxID=876091 RepID=UPI0026197E9E|nr:hypothetical protein [uncultured Oscillibacter sp.]